MGQRDSKSLRDIPFHQAESLIRAELRVDQYWGPLAHQVEAWQRDEASKVYLDKNFNYELAMIALTCKDFDRARFFIDRETVELLTKWKNLTKLTQIAQHILVQKIQKIYEMKEFLSTIKSEGVLQRQELLPLVTTSISHWTQRVPNSAFDQVGTWDDLLTARNLFLDLYSFRLKDELTLSLKREHLEDIRAILQVQCAKGSFKMGLYDSSDRYLKKALELRAKGASSLKIVGPIIKLKSEQFKTESLNLGFGQKTEKLAKIIDVLDNKMREAGEEEARVEVKGLMLRQQLEKKMLNIILEEVRQEESVKGLRQYEEGLGKYLGKTFATLGEIFEKVKAAAQYDDQMKKTMAKTHYKFA